jgi:hypothetical protein
MYPSELISFTEKHSLRWSSVSAVTRIGEKSDEPTCVSECCYTVAVHMGSTTPPTPALTHTCAKEGGREMKGRAKDSSGSYSCMWGVATCGSAISMEASYAAEE